MWYLCWQQEVHTKDIFMKYYAYFSCNQMIFTWNNSSSRLFFNDKSDVMQKILFYRS